jgi:hypothetical protein
VIFSLLKLTYLLTLATSKMLNLFLLVFFNGQKMVRHKSPGEYEAVERNSPIGFFKRHSNEFNFFRQKKREPKSSLSLLSM